MGSDIKISKKNVLSYVMLAVAVLLLVVSVVQAYQISAIGGGSGEKVSEKSAPTAVQSQVARQAAQQAPAMVGGC